jgi:hypothetical protein
MFENKVSRRIFGPKEVKEQGSGGNYLRRKFIIYTLHIVLLK